MADIKLFKIGNVIDQLSSSSVVLERELQVIIEKNMQTFFGVHFLASEYVINGGRIDSIGIDENNCPVIFEYKRSLNENVINQGLFYLNWLLEHKADYKLLVLEQFGKEIANKIDWSMPRVICIAGDFNKYDEEAMSIWGDGARAQIVVLWERGGGHTFVAEQENGKTHFYDPQNAQFNCSLYFDDVVLDSVNFCRIDRLNPSEYIKECMEVTK